MNFAKDRNKVIILTSFIKNTLKRVKETFLHNFSLSKHRK